ncbi:hypothetical protein QVD17_12645 [Tagetes erecta]|uniref:Uncharacterized protein n=1 Tax=Tagetes erecta TaxID=13708 RepID=A0AAD8KWV6_TARER|nr:hypothetical protein QVD17_12645 [Tagetes erecta]
MLVRSTLVKIDNWKNRMIKGEHKIVEFFSEDVLNLDSDIVKRIKDLPIMIKSNKDKKTTLMFRYYIITTFKYWKLIPLEEFTEFEPVEVKEEEEFDTSSD